MAFNLPNKDRLHRLGAELGIDVDGDYAQTVLDMLAAGAAPGGSLRPSAGTSLVSSSLGGSARPPAQCSATRQKS